LSTTCITIRQGQERLEQTGSHLPLICCRYYLF